MNCNKQIRFDKNFNIIVEEEFDSEYAFVYILQHTYSDGNCYNRVLIKDSEEFEVKFPTTEDGFYTLITLKVPLNVLNYFYYRDGKFYKGGEEVELQEIIDTNPHLSNIDPIYDYYFLTARLRMCYIKASEDVFDTIGKCLKPGENRELTYKRDLIWSALNAVEYMAEMDLFEEAQRYLEKFVGCNGICKSDEYSYCGCHE